MPQRRAPSSGRDRALRPAGAVTDADNAAGAGAGTDPDPGRKTDIPLPTLLRAFSRSAVWLLLIVLPAYLIIRLLVANEATNTIFIPLQQFETAIVVAISRAVGIGIDQVSGTDFVYTDPLPDGNLLSLRVGADCTGIMEIVFLIALVIAIVGVPWKVRLKWAGILGGILFAENILRMVLNYPLAVQLGGLAEWMRFHDFWFRYGQLMIVMALFFVWYWWIARRHLPVLAGDQARDRDATH